MCGVVFVVGDCFTIPLIRDAGIVRNDSYFFGIYIHKLLLFIAMTNSEYQSFPLAMTARAGGLCRNENVFYYILKKRK